MDKQPAKKSRSIKYTLRDAMADKPLMEIESNRKISIEGSRGVLLYSQEEIKVSMGDYSVSYQGKGLDLRYISSTSLVIEGFLKSIEFIL